MIIKSLLDTDLYKLTMMQAVFHNFPETEVKYAFKCRSEEKLGIIKNDLETEIDDYCKLRFTEEELCYLEKLSFFQKDFINYLRDFKINKNYLNIKTNSQGDLDIEIKGPWLKTILFEVPILSLVNEIWYKKQLDSCDLNLAFLTGKVNLTEKICLIEANPEKKRFELIEFGTRRRFSRKWQECILKTLKDSSSKNGFLSGTSNVYLAKKYNLPVIGTMAHEWLQSFQALSTKLEDSQVDALDVWTQEYGDELGIALTDVINYNAFLNDFDYEHAHNYKGVRHDSGDPIEWGEAMIKHYNNLGINTNSKKLVFSDGLTIPKALEIASIFNDRIKTSYGIGTNLSHDLGLNPLQVVMKIIECNSKPVAKISDSPGKSMCKDPNYIIKLKEAFNVEYSSEMNP